MKRDAVPDPTDDEKIMLTAYIAEQCPAPEYRPSPDKAPDWWVAYCKANRCAWWHNGVQRVKPGEWNG